MTSYTAHLVIEGEALSATVFSHILEQYGEYTPLWSPKVDGQTRTSQENIDFLHEVEHLKTDDVMPDIAISRTFGIMLKNIVAVTLRFECPLSVLDEFVKYLRGLSIKFAIVEENGSVWFEG